MKLVKKLIKKVIISLFPLRKIMVFESVPDLSDNTRAVFDEMIKRGVNKKYKMVWLKSEKTETEINEKNVFLLTRKKAKRSYYITILFPRC